MPKVFASDEESRAYNAETARRWYANNKELALERKKAHYATERGKRKKSNVHAERFIGA